RLWHRSSRKSGQFPHRHSGMVRLRVIAGSAGTKQWLPGGAVSGSSLPDRRPIDRFPVCGHHTDGLAGNTDLAHRMAAGSHGCISGWIAVEEEQITISGVAAPRAQFIKAADYDP